MSDHPDRAGEASIVRRRASRPRGGAWLWLLVLILLLVILWLTLTPNPNQERPPNQDSPDFLTFVLVVFLPIVLLAGFFVAVSAWFGAKRRPMHAHWFLTAIAVAGVLVGTVIWWCRQDFLGGLFLGLAGLLAFWFHLFSPFWYHFRTGVYLTNLNRYAEAEGHLQKAWRRAERYSPRDFRRGSILLALGEWHRVQLLYDKAEDYFQLALPILQAHEQQHFLELGLAYNNLGVLYYERGKYVEAEIYFRQAYSLACERCKGNRWLVGLTEQNVAGALMELEDYDEAEALLWSAEKKTRWNVEVWLLTLGKLAKLNLRKNNLERAEGCALEALPVLQKSLHVSAPISLSVLVPATEINRRQGDLDEAERQAAQALEIAEKPGNRFPSSRVWAMTNLAAVWSAKDRRADAERLFRQAALLHEEHHLPDNLNWAESLEEFADLLRRMDREAEATTWENRAQNVRRHCREYQAAPRSRDERLKVQSPWVKSKDG